MTVGPGEASQGGHSPPADADLASLGELAPVGYLTTAPDGLISTANQAFLTMIGRTRQQLAGRRFADLLTPGGQIYHETHYAPLLFVQGSVQEIAMTLACADGTRRAVLVNSVLERDEQGEPVVIRVAVFEATQRRSYEQELYKAKERAEAAEVRATALARTLQQTLIPPTLPSIPGLDLAARYRPAGDGTEVGGDFYDVFQLARDDWIVVLGDVCGKGAEAAVITALARYTIRAAAVEHPEPRSILRLLNTAIRRQSVERFCSVGVLRLIRAGEHWRCQVTLAGHELPLLRRADGSVETVGRPGLLLGVVPHPELHVEEFLLQPGELVLMCTDGVSDGRQGQEFFGPERTEQSVAAHGQSADEAVTNLLSSVMAFQSGSARDDIAIVAVALPVS